MSNNIGPASDAANKAGLVYITSGGPDEALTQRGLKNFFRINNTAGYSKALLGLLAAMGVKSIVYITKEAPADLAKDVEKSLVAKGVKVTMHAFDQAITDFKPIINKIKLQDKPDVIAMVGYENDYVGILRAANRDTLIGKVAFDEKGDNPHFSHRMGQHQNGKVVIVWPKEYATGKMNFPGVPW